MGKKEEVSRQFLDALEFRGISRRDFLKYCGATAALLGLSELCGPKIAAALEKAAKRPPVIWLNFASDSGCTEAFIKATYPSPAEVILDILSVDYNETIMAAAGKQSEEILASAAEERRLPAVIEGGIPTKKGHGMIGNKEMLDVFKENAMPGRRRDRDRQLRHRRRRTRRQAEPVTDHRHRGSHEKAGSSRSR